MSLQNLTPDQLSKVEALKTALAKLTKGKLIEIRDNLKKADEGESGNAWEPFERNDPITFGTEVLRLEPNLVQKELGLDWYTEDQGILFNAVANNRRVLALSGNGVGKTYSAAIISLWLFHRGYTVLTTAPTLAQVTDILWAEMRSMKIRAMRGLGGSWQPKANKAEFGPLHFMQGFTVQTDMVAGVSTAFQGRHKAKMAIVMDEVIGMSAGVIEACDRICVGPQDIVVGIGNPTDTTAPIRRAADIRRDDGSLLWKTIHISGENHPNVRFGRTVIPGAVSAEMVADQLAKAGSRDGSIYKASVLGQWPDETPDTLIPRAWILAAQERGKKPRQDDYRGKSLGIDVAGEGGDLTPAFCVYLSKPYMPRLLLSSSLRSSKAWIQGRDTQHCVDLVNNILRSEEDIRAIGIDDTGIGQGPRSQLQRERVKFPRFLTYKRTSLEEYNKERQATVTGYNFSATPQAMGTDRFARLKDQLWWELREAFRLGKIDLPSDEEIRTWELPNGSDLVDQLCTPIHVQDGQGRIIVLDKRGAAGAPHRERTKLLPDKSPDLAHALMIAWHVYLGLPTGQKPITSMIELQSVELQIAKQKMKKRLTMGRQKKYSRSHRQLPWRR